MTKEERKAKAELHKKLVDLLTEGETDDEYFKRLVWANQIIANIFSNWQVMAEEQTSVYFAPARDLYVQFCIQYFLKIFIDKFQIL